MVAAIPTVALDIRQGIRDSGDTLFWMDCWLDSGIKLVNHILMDRRLPDLDTIVADLVTTSGEWNIILLHHQLLEYFILQIVGMSPPSPVKGEDIPVWGPEKDGRLWVRSAYDLLGVDREPVVEVDWRSGWNWRGPNRIQHLLWLAVHNKLLTNDERRKRHVTEDGTCTRCQGSAVTVLHVLWDCPAAVRT
ncbi:Putative ribonuclease H protein At1g65750 [Linum grandiflorum]